MQPRKLISTLFISPKWWNTFASLSSSPCFRTVDMLWNGSTRGKPTQECMKHLTLTEKRIVVEKHDENRGCYTQGQCWFAFKSSSPQHPRNDRGAYVVLPAVWGQWLGVCPALSLLPGLTPLPLPGYVIVVIRTVVHLWLPGSTSVSIWTSFIAIHCPGAGHIFQDFMVFAIRWLWWWGSLVGRGCGGRGGCGGGGRILLHLVSMRDEEVLNTVHGRICLCWSFAFVSVPGWCFQERKVGQSSRRRFFSTCSSRITGTAAQLRPSLAKKKKKQSAGWHEVNKGDSKSIIHAIHAQLLSWVLTSTDSLQDGVKEKKKFPNHHKTHPLSSHSAANLRINSLTLNLSMAEVRR